VNAANVVDGVYITSSTCSALTTGTYMFTFTYKDLYSNPAAQTLVTSILVASSTSPATINAPASNTRYRGIAYPISYTLPNPGSEGYLVFTSMTTSPYTRVWKLSSTGLTQGTHTMTVDVGNAVAGSGGKLTSAQSLRDDLYNLTLVYRDDLGNGNASTINTRVIVDSMTTPATWVYPSTSDSTMLGSPTNGAGVEDQASRLFLCFMFMLPENTTGIVTLRMNNSAATYLFNFTATTSGQTTRCFIPRDVQSIRSDVVSVFPTSVTSISDSVAYDVQIYYRDDLGNPVAFSTLLRNIHIDVTAGGALLTRPLEQSVHNRSIGVSYLFQKPAYPGTAKLVLLNDTTSAVMATLVLQDNVTSAAFTWDTSTDPSIEHSQYVTSFTGSLPLPDGNYTFNLQFKAYDSGAQPVMNYFTYDVRIDTTAGICEILNPTAATLVNQSVVLWVSLSEHAKSGSETLTLASATTSITLTFKGQGASSLNPMYVIDPRGIVLTPTGAGDVISSTAQTIPTGVYTLTYSYRDAVNNGPSTCTQAGINVTDSATRTTACPINTNQTIIVKQNVTQYINTTRTLIREETRGYDVWQACSLVLAGLLIVFILTVFVLQCSRRGYSLVGSLDVS